jgi:ssDNA thymidine ADP-ribosyltransferase, DarT
LSRRDAQALLRRDVAPDEIINANHAAHAYARLYFRPRTPTQYRIEGIRRPDEIWNGKHAPVIYMFVFKSRELLTREGVHFSRGNMQVPGTEILDGDDHFGGLNFSKIYHEGSYGLDDADIKIWRCAEVLVDSPLNLDDCLEAIVCRSDAERKTLLHILGDVADAWASKVQVLSQPGFFNAEYAFVESVDLSSDGVHVRFHPRVKLPMEAKVDLTIWKEDNPLGRRDFRQLELDIRKNWRFPFELEDGLYQIEIKIEGELAYKNALQFSLAPF